MSVFALFLSSKLLSVNKLTFSLSALSFLILLQINSKAQNLNDLLQGRNNLNEIKSI
jgi:hypothetical protein